MNRSLFGRHTCAVAMLPIVRFLSGCDVASAESLTDSCRALGLCDEPPKPAVSVDILCDASIGSSCDQQTLGKTLDRVLSFVADREHSRVGLWTLGKNVAETERVAEQVVPAYPRGSAKAHAAHARRFQETAKAFLLAAAERGFEGPGLRRSPLAEALSKMAMSDSSELPRVFIPITDGRDVSSLGDFECLVLPSESRFLGLLKRRSLLVAGSLAGVKVEFAFVRSAGIPGRGCAVDMDREARIRRLWAVALRAAGAANVRLSSGPPIVSDESVATTEKETKE